jgi:hypothetical protein
MDRGPSRLETSIHKGWTGLPKRSLLLRSAEETGAQDGSWSCCCFTWLYLAAKPSHMGANVARLACLLHRPMVYGWQTMAQSPLIGAALCHHTVTTRVARAYSRGVKPPRVDVQPLLFFTWSLSFS